MSKYLAQNHLANVAAVSCMLSWVCDPARSRFSVANKYKKGLIFRVGAHDCLLPGHVPCCIFYDTRTTGSHLAARDTRSISTERERSQTATPCSEMPLRSYIYFNAHGNSRCVCIYLFHLGARHCSIHMHAVYLWFPFQWPH